MSEFVDYYELLQISFGAREKFVRLCFPKLTQTT